MGREHAYVLAGDWTGPRRSVDRASALAELARRYLRGHGPAGERDLARWAGLPLRDARAGFAAIADHLHDRGDGRWALTPQPPRRPSLPRPRLLGAFDPTLLGWASRDDILGDGAEMIVQGGIFRPFALVSGRAAAIWAIRSGRVVLEPLRPLGSGVERALKLEGEDVSRFLGPDP